MTKPTDVAKIAYAAGFRGLQLIQAVAVSLAEDPSGDPFATHTNTDGSVDRGLWQINSKWHSEVTDNQAFDPTAAALQVFRISGGGSDWSPWATWPGAAGQEIVRAANAVANAGIDVAPGGPTPIVPGLPTGDPTAGIGQSVSDALKDVSGNFTLGNVTGNLGDIVKAVAAIPVTLGNGLDELKNLGTFFQQPNLWIRVLMVIGGGIVILIGLILTALSFVPKGSIRVPVVG